MWKETFWLPGFKRTAHESRDRLIEAAVSECFRRGSLNEAETVSSVMRAKDAADAGDNVIQPEQPHKRLTFLILTDFLTEAVSAKSKSEVCVFNSRVS